MASSLRLVLETYSEKCIFCCVIQYIESKKHLVGSVPEALAESLESAFDEAPFIVNLHSFLQPPALPRQPFSPSESFVPTHLGRTTSKTPRF